MSLFARLQRRLPKFSRVLRKGRTAILITAGLAILVATQLDSFRNLRLLTRAELGTVDYRFSGRSALKQSPPPSPDVVIVGINASSLDQTQLEKYTGESEAIRLMYERSWPWNRKVFALVIERLMELGAKVVALDILFPGEREGNEELAAVIKKYPGRVVVGRSLVIEDPTAAQRGVIFIKPHETVTGEVGDRAVGSVSFNEDIDGVLRRVDYRTSELRLYGEEDESQDLPGFSILASSLFQGREPPSGYGQPINYQGRAATYPYLPIEEIFIDPLVKTDPRFRNGEVFRDKIVFVGPIAETFHDVHRTPFEMMPGVEIHAHVAGAMLQGRRLSETDELTDRLLTAGAVLIALLVLLLVPKAATRLAALLVVAIGYCVIAQMLFVEPGVIIPIVIPLAAFVGAGSFGVSFDLLLEQSQRTLIKDVLDRYVDRNVANIVLEQHDSFEQSLRGKKKPVTVLFSDIRGFTTISETRDPEQLVGQLNEYFLPMVDAVRREGGTLQKFIGDAIMGAWGDTHSLGEMEDAERAVRSALQMRTALTKLNAAWSDDPDRLVLSSGIGVNHGDVVVGRVGHPDRMEFTVLGDGVNLAARLESATKQFHCDILVGEKVQELTNDRFVYRRVDKLCFKGKSQPIEVFTPLSEIDEPAPVWLKRYHDAMRQYRARHFEQAMVEFAAVRAELGGADFLCSMYEARCARYQAQPPAEHWDGSHVLTEK